MKKVTLLMSDDDAKSLEFNNKHGNSVHFGSIAEDWSFTLVSIKDELDTLDFLSGEEGS